jgi:hypothetical protein
MIDEERNPVVSVKVAGRMRRLATPKQWRSAIANGELARDTPVTLERGLGRQAQMAAGDVEELFVLFDELIGPAVAPPPPLPLPPPPPSLQPSPATPSPLPTSPERLGSEGTAMPPPVPPSAAAEDELEEDASEEYYPSDPEPPVTNDIHKAGRLIGAGLVLLVAIGFVLSNRSEHSAASDEAEGAMIAAGSQYSERFYASRDLPTRASPSESARESGQISRGEQVLTTPPVDGWVELANGGFVRFADLLTSRPPEIDLSTREDYFTIEPAEVLDAPDAGASSFTSINKMTRVSVVGTVNENFAEIVSESGQVGYVNWESFGGIGGKGRSAWVAVNNRCGSSKHIAFSFTVDGTRSSHSGYWTFPSSYNGAIEYGDLPGDRIYVDSVFNFFADLGDDFPLRGSATVFQEGDDKVRVNGRLVEMKRMVPELTPDGAYQVTFC